MAQTRGFQVSNMPQAASVDPRLLAFSPQALTQGYDQGLRSYGNLMQIQQARDEAPIRQQLLQLQQENAQLNNARLAQPIESVTGIALEDRARGEDVIDEFGEVVTRAPRDLFQIETVRSFDPITGSVNTSQRPSKTVLTEEARKASQDNAEYRQAMATAREQEVENRRIAAEARAENERLRAQIASEKEARLSGNPNLRGRTVERNGNRYIEYFNPSNPSVVVDVVDKGPVRESGIGALLSLVSGGSPVAQQVAQPVVQAPSLPPQSFSPEIQGLMNRVGAQPIAPASAPVVQFSGQDREAYDWAIANPNDPRSARILQRLGVQ